MKHYAYKGKNESGSLVEGMIDAVHQSDALRLLSEQGVYPTAIEEVSRSKKGPAGPRSFFVSRRVPGKTLYLYTSQLAHLLKSGLPLLKSLELLRKQEPSPVLQQVTGRMIDELRQGKHFSECLAEHETLFGRFYIAMVRSGEASGTLDTALERLANELERDYEMRSQLTNACIYPAVIFAVGIITVLIIMFFVIPKMSLMYDELGETLPLVTRVLVGMSTFMLRFWWVIIGGLIAGAYGVKRLTVLAVHNYRVGAMLLKIPIWGKLIQRENIVRASKTMGLLLASGVPVLESLAITDTILSNAVYKRSIEEARTNVQQGMPLSETFAASSPFPLVVVNLIAVGEESGGLDTAFEQIAQLFEKELDREIKLVMRLIEPMLIICIGSMVGLIAVAMFLPIFQIDLLAQ